MKNLILTCIAGLALGFMGGCKESAPADSSTRSTNSPTVAAKPSDTAPSSKEVAVIHTSAGDMIAEFWPDVAPKTVENFETLAKKGFYDGTAFHRIIKGFMIQAGDPNTKDASAQNSYGQGGPGYTIPDEFNDRPHVRGVLSMAHTQLPNSGGSQFFICLGDTPQLNNKYTAFGKVIKGDDVLGKLGDSPCTGPNSMGEYSIPKPRVDLISIKIVPADSIK